MDDSSSDSVGEANLARLPAEIFELGAEKVERADLLALRQTSRECADKVFRTYCSALFPPIRIFISHEEKNSIERAINIAQHPVFGALVKDLTVFIDDCMTCFKSESSRRSETGKVLQKRYIIRQKLERLFEALRLTGHQFNLRVTCRRACNCTGKHLRAGCNSVTPTTRRNLIDVLDQLQQSSLLVSHLEIGGPRWTFTTQKLRDFEMKVYQSAFENLNSLKLFISMRVTDVNDGGHGLRTLMATVAKAHGLKTLHVQHILPGCSRCIVKEQHLPMLADAIWAHGYPSLRELRLGNFVIRARQLANFVKEHENTLKNLFIGGGLLWVEELHPDQVQGKSALEVLKEVSGFTGLEVDGVFEERYQRNKHRVGTQL